MSGSLFIYPPLKRQDSIRLLHIHKAHHIDEPLSASLTEIQLSSTTNSPKIQHAYIALSYCWGSQEKPQPVIIDQRILFIGQNLSDALRHLRKPDRDAVVWADGLCINQDDLEERSSQVKMMRNIYSQAARTVVFLGLEGGNTSISAWNYLERESHSGAHYKCDSNSGPRFAEEAQTQKQKSTSTSIPGFRGGLQDVEIDVLTRRWFRRVWVMQEVVVSRNIIVQCGRRRVSWDDFCKILLLQQRVNDRYGFSLSRHHLYEYLLRMVSARFAFLRSHGQTHILPPWHDRVRDEESRSDGLIDMLSRARSLEATEPRDKIFAVLGISAGIDKDAEASLIDYSLPVAKVYRNFAEYMIESSQSYDILSAVAVTTSDGMPSWVPDWGTEIGLPR
ncbi:heterokaryon incompatibility protein-domain-containing protein, partial [Rhexocercosporidium sp. MPI-PUGE-AT-0058]